MIKVAAIVGPTASGKTALAIEIAQRHNGEVISCDSMQIYRGMNIGTAKPTADEMRGIPHHMIDIADPSENFSCSDYADMAKKCIADIHERGKLPIMCGGTGLYLDSVLTGNKFVEIKTDEALRTELFKRQPDDVYAELKAVDPESASAIHPNNFKRVVRALEIYITTGRPKSDWDKESRLCGSEYAPMVIGLDYSDREVLYRRIDKRVDIMMESGLAEEVRALNLPENSTASQAIGYKEIISYLRGECSLETAVNNIKSATRHYCKRQLTWFRRNKDINWFIIEENFKDIVNNVETLLNN